MKNRIKVTLAVLLIGSNLSALSQVGDVVIKGTVHKWPTDTIYFYELPFHSPYSFNARFVKINSDSTFRLKYTDIEKTFVFMIGPQKTPLDLKVQDLLFDNLTSDHYYGHCIKVYTVGVATFLVKPKTNLDLDITFNTWIEKLSQKRAETLKRMGIHVFDDNTVRDYGTTELIFHGSEQFSYEYYQESFNLDDKLDKLLERTKEISSAIKKLEKRKTKLLSSLKKEQNNLDAQFYNYIKAEIEFGAKKEFLKYLQFEHEEYLTNLFNEEIPTEIMKVVEFDKSNIIDEVLINEEYNEYLELYLNFKMNMKQKKYIVFNEFSKSKYDLAIAELPNRSKYYYLANNLLHTKPTSDFFSLYEDLIQRYPEGELNDKLYDKFEK